ncbi:ABC transporter ATP-binding protein [Dethiosulfatarculus sandiegensis]|uniref:sn-glycerol-3-phosphate ABC transporter ATP-binding protein n=1 Tax=Dethiosulfatarculus sandiegensis TaxID=1429043 RepID=A0A0D2GB42_9BACT|nr:sn-glycerol-3-phosphate ABC transporter ATP-binding protein UgpC [Dethiosulfatarculus sandiegensis]KIX12062.1 sn-glycerol-3-phosphate ABC transporter ATP-binding protein [Dethiosulfatarculus sandiegensis]
MAQVVLRNLRKNFGDTEVLKGINATIADGEFLVVVGPSGCGKSTVLRLVAGLERITEGEVHIGDKLVNRLEPKDRDVAMVFQNYALYPHMSVYKNIAYGLKVRGIAKREISQRVDQAASLLGLSPFLGRKPNQLSGGQRQRVAMGRAIVRKPRVFLFDEPLSNLDAKLRTQMRVNLKRLHQNLKTTSIYVTHDQVEAMTLADRILLIKDGQVEQLGTPEEIYKNPATVFAARFMGSPAMNLLSGSLLPKGAGLLLTDGTRLKLNGARPGDYQGEVMVGIRPEFISLEQPGQEPEPGLCSLKARVELLEPLGSENLVHCDLGAGEEEKLVLRLPGELRAQEGGVVKLRFSQQDLHFFEAGTQKRISTDH